MSKIKKICMIFLVTLILILIIGFVNRRDNFIDWKKNEIYVKNASEMINIDKEKPKSIFELNMSLENKALSVIVLDVFEDGNNLSPEQYLNVVYNALISGYVTFEGKTNNFEYTEAEINSIVYNIFGVELAENKSINGLKYENGTYILEPTNEDSILVIKNLERDVAAGTAYIEFDLYKENSFMNHEYKGKYIITMNQNTETSDKYVKSMKLE